MPFSTHDIASMWTGCELVHDNVRYIIDGVITPENYRDAGMHFLAKQAFKNETLDLIVRRKRGKVLYQLRATPVHAGSSRYNIRTLMTLGHGTWTGLQSK
jgi:hypothetical protein